MIACRPQNQKCRRVRRHRIGHFIRPPGVRSTTGNQTVRGSKAPDGSGVPSSVVRAVAVCPLADARNVGVGRGIIGPVAVQAPLHVRRTPAITAAEPKGHARNGDPEADARAGPPRRGVIVAAIIVMESRAAVAVPRTVPVPVIVTPAVPAGIAAMVATPTWRSPRRWTSSTICASAGAASVRLGRDTADAGAVPDSSMAPPITPAARPENTNLLMIASCGHRFSTLGAAIDPSPAANCAHRVGKSLIAKKG
jgi:hypothetical protein